MKKTILQCLLLVCVIILFFGSLAYTAPVGKITKLEGRVDVLKSAQNRVANVSLGDDVDVGDIFRAKTNSRAEITFFNKNILRIHPATRVQISQYTDDGTQSNQIMKMDRGKVEAVSSQEFAKRVSSFAEGNKFEVHTPNTVAGIYGSGMTVGFAQMVTGLFFSTGRGYFYNPNQPGVVRNVSAGFVSFVVGTGGLPSRPVPGNVSYVGGSAGAAPGSLTASTTTGLIQTTNIINPININPINQTYTVTPPPQVPTVFVGVIPSLSGYASDGQNRMDVSVKDVKFYGPGVVSAPQTWTTATVSGQSYMVPISYFVGQTANLSSQGSGQNTAQFTISGTSGSSSGTYSATITNGRLPLGVGSYTQPVTFSGTSSGTFTTSNETGTLTSSFSGTASGTAK